MDSAEALRLIKRGQTCLWVGAGVGIQLADASIEKPPQWSDLVASLEKEAGVSPPSGLTEYAGRLDAVLARLGRRKFQRELRTRVLQPTARSIVETWRRTRKDPPAELKALAHLGFLANPIVNFNIETLSSQALVIGSGPWHPVVFSPPVPDALTEVISHRNPESAERYYRRVYHPHGAIELSGICVMTEREYRSMNGTLALQLATHAAFGLDLAIVGMSLEDAYLRSQIEQFRHQIGFVFWIVNSPPRDALAEWCYRTQIELVHVSWNDFWRDVTKELPGPKSGILAFEWLSLAQQASRELGQPMTDATNRLLFAFQDEVALEDAVPRMAPWFWKAVMHGEVPAAVNIVVASIYAACRRTLSSAGRFNHTSFGSDQSRIVRHQRSG